jgi:putative chitinase
MFDRPTYFNAVRASMFQGALTQQQVDGQNAILSVWENEQGGTPMTDLRWLAYMLATVYHECATRMWPVTEYGSQSYLKGKPYYPYIGRGLVQLTWEDNYRKAGAALGLIDDRDLIDHPEVALDSMIACRIMYRGMAEGWFTGKRLSQYFNETKNDPKNARQIINGNDDDKLIAGYHDKFLSALKTSWQDEVVSVPPEPIEPIQVLAALTVPEGVEMVVTVNGLPIGPSVLDA